MLIKAIYEFRRTPMLLLQHRLIKIFSNGSKGLCYVYHFFKPNKRFILPDVAPAHKKAMVEQKIPRVIWQTNFTNKVTLPVYLNYLFNRWISPTYEYRFVSTEERANFIKSNFPKEIFDCYLKLQIGAAQADFWRVLMLYKYGGVYLDIDAFTITSLDNIVKPEDMEVYIMTKNEGLSNFFIASAPNNPNLEKIINKIKQNISERSSKNVFYLTGPGVFNTILDIKKVRTAFYRQTCDQGCFTNEYFQYIDKPQGKWTKEQEKTSVIKPE
jgi:mannosyltransferase OCH1-like enzyme